MNDARGIDIPRSEISNIRFEVALLNKIALLRILVVASTVALWKSTEYIRTLANTFHGRQTVNICCSWQFLNGGSNHQWGA